MKILALAFHWEEYFMRLTSGMIESDENLEILLMLPEASSQRHLKWLNENVTFKSFDLPRLREPFKQIALMFQLVSEIKKFDPDVIHVQNGHLWFNLFIPFLRKYPLIITVHDAKRHPGDHDQKTPQFIMDFGMYRSSQLIVHSPQIKQIVLDRLKIAPEKVNVVPTLIRGDDQESQEVQDDGKSILFFGRIFEYKGLEYLIKAEPLITQAVPDAKIVIAGRGEDINRYIEMMQNKDAFILYNKFIPDSELARLFRESSVVVLPYTEASQSGVIPHAYNFSKAVVATNVGGLPDLVDDGKTGYLVPPRDVEALAEAVIKLLQDEKLRREFGENGKKKIELQNSPVTIAPLTLDVYRKAIAS